MGYEFVFHGSGEGLKACEAFAFHFLFFVSEDFRVEGLLEFEQVPEDAGQFVGHGGDGLWTAEAGLPAAV